MSKLVTTIKSGSEATLLPRDTVLVKVLVGLVIKEDWYSIKEIKYHVIKAYGQSFNWLTSEFIGRAMKCKGFNEKRRIETGMEYFLVPSMVILVAREMGIDIK